MSYMQTILSAAKRKDIIEYFEKISKFDETAQEFIFADGVRCKIQQSRPNPIAPLIIHTPLIFTGPKELVEVIMQNFRVKFLTAGG
jgi:hypothetical protein